MLPTRSTLLPALCALAFAGGCGDDEGDAALSYEDTGAEISEICQSLEREFDGLTGEAANDAPILEEGRTAVNDAIERIRELEVDEQLEGARDELVESFEAELPFVDAAQEAAARGDQKAYRQALNDPDAQAADAESDAVASRVGAEGCSG